MIILIVLDEVILEVRNVPFIFLTQNFINKQNKTDIQSNKMSYIIDRGDGNNLKLVMTQLLYSIDVNMSAGQI